MPGCRTTSKMQNSPAQMELIGPLELYDGSKPEWQMSDFIKADAVVKTGLIDGLAANGG